MTGCRLGELTGARVRDLDPSRSDLKVAGKTGGREVHLAPPALRLLEKLAARQAAARSSVLDSSRRAMGRGPAQAPVRRRRGKGRAGSRGDLLQPSACKRHPDAQGRRADASGCGAPWHQWPHDRGELRQVRPVRPRQVRVHGGARVAPSVRRRQGRPAPLRRRGLMLTIRDWRGTKEGRVTLQAFPGKKLRELADIIEPRPGFRDAAARRRFATDVRHWAYFWLCQEAATSACRPSRRPRPSGATPCGSWAARRPRWRSARRRCASSCTGCRTERGTCLRPPWALRPLSAARRRSPGWSRTRGGGRRLRRAAGLGRPSHRGCQPACDPGRCGRAGCGPGRPGSAPGQAGPKPGRRDPDLAQIWLDATGHAPTRSWNEYRGERYGAFPDLCLRCDRAPLARGGKVDGLIDEVCSEFRSRSGNSCLIREHSGCS